MDIDKLKKEVCAFIKKECKADCDEGMKLNEIEAIKDMSAADLKEMAEKMMKAMAGKFKAELKTASEEPSKLRISKTSTPADIAAKIEKMADKEEAVSESFTMEEIEAVLDEAKKKKAGKDADKDKDDDGDDDDDDSDDEKKDDDDEEEEDDDDDDKLDEKKKLTPEQKAEKKEAEKKKKEEKAEAKKKAIKEQIDSLFAEDETLGEEFKEKAAFLFETVLTEKIKEEAEEIRVELKEEFDKNLQEAIEEHSERLTEELESLTEKIDEYLTYVAEEWMSENEIAVEKGIRTEITEQFIGGLKSLFKENYIEVPEGKDDFVHSLEEKNDELVEQINVHLKRNMNLKKQLQEEKKFRIIDERSSDLNLADKEQLKSLAESVDFENDEEFGRKVQILKEHYFSGVERPVESRQSDLIENERTESATLTEEYYEQPAQVGSAIDVYKQAISKYKF
jgi:hypothetical protein